MKNCVKAAKAGDLGGMRDALDLLQKMEEVSFLRASRHENLTSYALLPAAEDGTREEVTCWPRNHPEISKPRAGWHQARGRHLQQRALSVRTSCRRKLSAVRRQ